MFSKPLYKIGENIDTSNKKNENATVSYNDYFKKNIVLKKYKIPELKQIAKQNKIQVSGTKPVLIERIETFFNKCKKIQKIQSTFKGFLVRKSNKLRGEGYRNNKKCVNENDFYTLEPLHEIPNEYFVSFKSNDDKFIFGCNIISLMHLLKNKTAIKNPYNREEISCETVKQMIILYNMIKILFKLPEDAPILNHTVLIQSYTNINENRVIQNTIFRHNTHVPSVNGYNIPLETIRERAAKLATMRTKPMIVRINELFMEIDILGNYTNSNWFLNLERRDYVRLYRVLYDIWVYRGSLSREMKHKICCVQDPFMEVNAGRFILYEMDVAMIREICLKIFENMVYCGIDEEYRKIGSLHALSALTIVSIPARNAMPWLYESLYP